MNNSEIYNVELTKDEINLLLQYLDVDVCASKGCIDKDAESCENCKVMLLSAQMVKKLKAIKK